MALTPAQRRRLRARAHALKPVVQVGDAGVSEPLLAEAGRALEHHELIKVRLPALAREARAAMAATLCAALGAEQVQAVGHISVLYRRRARQDPPRRRAHSGAGRGRAQR